jgi:UDPglucose 6-dehydrogenase
MFNIGIVGHGFVGKAVDYGFSMPNVEKYLVDPNYGTTVKSMFEHFTPNVVFIAVPTPMGDDGTINSRIIESVFEDLANANKNVLAVIKSTITPEVIQKLKKIYNRIIYNPEFLTERNANRDFVEAPMLIIGGDDEDDMLALKDMYDRYSLCEKCPTHYVDLEAASMIKYTLNCFMAAKVLFFNQIHSIYEKSGTKTDWNQFIHVIKTDPRMGESHMAVPGPDGRYGYGGACFPKDTAALVKYARNINEPFTALEEVVKANQKIRSQYTDLDAREKEQNVSFNVL